MPQNVAPWLAGLDDAWELPRNLHSPKSTSASGSASSLRRPGHDSMHGRRISGLTWCDGTQKSRSTQSTAKRRSPLATLNSNRANSLRRPNGTLKYAGTRSVSEVSDGSVLQNGTVQQRSKSASPTKKQETLEWKRRLVHGRVGYGDQTDLFGATGLENIFARSQGEGSTAPTRNKRMSWMPPDSDAIMPSSPPPMPSSVPASPHFDGHAQDNSSAAGLDAINGESQVDACDGLSQQTKIETICSNPFDLDISEHRMRGEAQMDEQAKYSPSSSPQSTVDAWRSNVVGNRTVSGQTELEGFSPVFVSKQTSVTGNVNYAALDSHTLKQFQNLGLRSADPHHSSSLPSKVPIEELNAEEPSCFTDGPTVNDSQPLVADFSLSENLPTGTPPVANLGRFVELERGGYSRIGSFKQRPLSPSPTKTESGLLSVLPSSIHPVSRSAKSEYGHETPARPTTPNPTKTRSSGSPLKLFGPHDTFTNNRLLRRISQLDPEPEQQAGALPAYDEASNRSARERQVSGCNSFGSGELDTHGFNAEVTITSASDESRYGSDRSPASENQPPGSREPLSFTPDDQPAVQNTYELKRRLSKHSVKTSVGSANDSTHYLAASMNPTVEDVTDADLGQKAKQRELKQFAEGKRPPTSPFKNPTPKRRRTLHASEVEEAPLPQDDALNPTPEMRSGRKRKDARPGDPQYPANPEILSQRKMLRPRNPTPSQRRASELEADIDEAAEVFATQQPERLQELMDQLDASMSSEEDIPTQHHAETIATEVAEFTIRVTQASGEFTERKRSLNTQDFTAEAMKVMSALRAKHGQRSGLASVEESDADAFERDSFARSSAVQSSVAPRSPRSPHGHPNGPRPQPASGTGTRIVSKLRRFQETEETQYIAESEGSFNIADGAGAETSEVVEDEYSNIRITIPSGTQRREHRQSDASQQFSQRTVSTQQSTVLSSAKTPGTGSTRRSDNLGTLAPDAVNHLIGPAMGPMSFDSQRNCWVKAKSPKRQDNSFLEPPSQMSASDDDPLREISDLPVDEQLERRRISSPGKPTGPSAESTVEASKIEGGIRPDQQSMKVDTESISQETVIPRPVTRDSSNTTEVYHNIHSSSVPSKYTAFGSSQQDGVETRATSWSDEEIRQRSSLGKTRQQHLAHVVVQKHLENLAQIPESPSRETDQDPSQMVFPAPPGQRIATAMATLQLHGNDRSEVSRLPSNTSQNDETQELSDAYDESDLDNGSSVQEIPTPGMRKTPMKPTFIPSSAFKGTSRQMSLRRQTLTGTFGPITHEASELSFVAPLPGERMMSVSLSVSRPVKSRYSSRVAEHDLQSSPSKVDPYATLLMSDLPDFTVNEEDESRPSENLLAKRLAQHAELQSTDRFALSRNNVVKALTDNHEAELYWEDLKQLDLKGRSLNALIGLDDFCNGVLDMDISNNLLADLEGAPSSIRHLAARSNVLDGLTDWTHLMNLQYLDVTGNRIDSLNGLGCLFHLRELRVDDNQIDDISGLLELDGLLKLSVKRNAVQQVDFEGCQLQRLTHLDLSGNLITNVEHLGDLASLQELRLDGNPLGASFTCCQVLPRLRVLSLKHCGLATLDVSAFPSLRTLEVDGNHLATVTGLSSLKSLETLSMTRQSLGEDAQCTLFDQSFDVRTIRLSHNNLSMLQINDLFLTVRHLELASVGLHDLPANLGYKMPNLRSLNLDFNSLRDLRPLIGIERLESLSICGNRVDRLRKTIATLNQLGSSLSAVDLRDNPVTHGLYAHTLFETCRQKLLVPHKGIPPTEEDVEDVGQSSALTLPARDQEQDKIYQSRLDEETRLKRRVYEIMVAHGCPALQTLDGAPFAKGKALAKDWIWDRLVKLGIVRKSGGSEGDCCSPPMAA